MTTDLDLTTYKALSFDCYGTLIDWEAGIAAVLAPWAREQRARPDRRRAAARLRRQRGGRRAGDPAALYPEVLAAAFRRTGNRLGRPVSDEWAQRLGNSVPDWPAFPDSTDALARLAKHYQLIILSNVHRDGFAGSNQRLRGDFAAIITAEDVGAYKPAENHFRALDTTLPELGVDRTGCCMSPRACSTTTSRPSARACPRCGSTGVTTAPVGGPPRSRPRNGPTTSSSPRWPTSPTPSTRPSPAPPPRADPAHLSRNA